MRAAYILWDEQRYKFNHSRPAQSVKCDRGILAAASEQSNVRALFVRGNTTGVVNSSTLLSSSLIHDRSSAPVFLCLYSTVSSAYSDTWSVDTTSKASCCAVAADVDWARLVLVNRRPTEPKCRAAPEPTFRARRADSIVQSRTKTSPAAQLGA